MKGFLIGIPDRIEDGVNVGKIDCIWESFSSWLQSDDRLFWIQGKPGSGKSTLMKFIIENDNTKCLLSSWPPNTRIISYFLWKIGQESQNSIKGLLCCLLHDLLDGDDQMVDKVLDHFSFSGLRDFYQEWSSEEAEKVLFFLLYSGSCSTCIFIDGLDEISDKDGFESLIRVLQRIWKIPRVKVCVSSRLETGLIRRLEAAGPQKLRLHDLTRPEMTVYIQKQLAEYSEGLISTSKLQKMITLLLEKAEGVFL
jgi:Cdc6-like AAA superfamily ATPase